MDEIWQEVWPHRTGDMLRPCPPVSFLEHAVMCESRHVDSGSSNADAPGPPPSPQLKPRKRQKVKKNKHGGLRKRRGAQVAPEVEALLGDANTKFAFGELDQARAALLEAIRIAPGYPDSYHTMGLVYQEQGDDGKALECFIIAAHLTARDHDLWKQLTTMSRDQASASHASNQMRKA